MRYEKCLFYVSFSTMLFERLCFFSLYSYQMLQTATLFPFPPIMCMRIIYLHKTVFAAWVTCGQCYTDWCAYKASKCDKSEKGCS